MFLLLKLGALLKMSSELKAPRPTAQLDQRIAIDDLELEVGISSFFHACLALLPAGSSNSSSDDHAVSIHNFFGEG